MKLYNIFSIISLTSLILMISISMVYADDFCLEFKQTNVSQPGIDISCDDNKLNNALIGFEIGFHNLRNIYGLFTHGG